MEQVQDFSNLFDRLTENAQGSLKHADVIARSMGNSYIGTEHLLLGVLTQGTSIGAKILQTAGVTLDRAKLALKLTPKNLVTSAANAAHSRGRLGATAKLTLKMSWEIAQEFAQEFLGTEHILYSLITQKNSRASTLLSDMNVNVSELKEELEQYLSSQQYEYEDAARGTPLRTSGSGRNKALDQFGVDLTAQASKGKLDPLIGREPQLERIVTILARRQKNNPVLIGDPGVGKTAIVEGLAQRIVAEEVPEILLDKKIIVLDLAGMIAGTKYRGEFEERLKKLLAEITRDSRLILFIDEVHLIVGAGAAEGAIDAGNILKPALARGALQVIGATTTDEYHKHIESDAALERRFQPIMVPEATLPESVAILRGLKGHYEDFHGVVLDEETLDEAAHLANRYITDRRMPDKAIDLIDETAATVRIERGKVPAEQRRILRMLKLAKSRVEEAVAQEDYQRAAIHKARVAQLDQRLQKLRQKRGKQARMKVTIDDLNKVVARATGVPIAKVRKKEAQYLLRLEEHLRKHVVGQDEAIVQVAKAIRRTRSGVSDTTRPIGSFVFMGPTGVGKTELARVIARELFHDESSLIKIDMSEFTERHMLSRLVGAPAGYVGYEEGGQLTDKVRRQPYSVILFDEIEKAHPEIFNVLLQILEDGRLSDAKGRPVDFTNTVIIMTSNLGAYLLQKEAEFGFHLEQREEARELETMHEQHKEKVTGELKSLMRPELLNRIDKTIVFRALTKKDAQAILSLQLGELESRLARKKLGLQLTSSARRKILEEGYDANNGVRPLRRAIQDEIEDKIAHGIISGSYQPGDIIQVGHQKKEFTFSTQSG